MAPAAAGLGDRATASGGGAGELLFPGLARGRTTTGSAMSGWSRLKRRLDAAAGIDDWHLHDLRRTMASGLAELGVRPHVIEATLTPVSRQITGVAADYNLYEYTDEKLEA